jgi:hypothetical protein
MSYGRAVAIAAGSARTSPVVVASHAVVPRGSRSIASSGAPTMRIGF